MMKSHIFDSDQELQKDIDKIKQQNNLILLMLQQFSFISPFRYELRAVETDQSAVLRLINGDKIDKNAVTNEVHKLREENNRLLEELKKGKSAINMPNKAVVTPAKKRLERKRRQRSTNYEKKIKDFWRS